MDTFSLDPRTWRVLFVFSRSPLVRRSDRLEVLVITLAVVISLVALPFVATIATDVYQAHRGVYAEQARTGLRASTPTPTATNVAPASAYRARAADPWMGNGTPHSGTVELWVDGAGKWVAARTALSRAASDAVAMAVLIEGLVVTIVTALVVATRWRLGRIRYAQWDRELGSVLGNEGGLSHGGGRAR